MRRLRRSLPPLGPGVTATPAITQATANAILATQLRDCAADLVGYREVAGARAAPAATSARATTQPRLYGVNGALPGQPALVFELLRATMAAQAQLRPDSAAAAVNAGWLRYFLSSVLDVFGPAHREEPAPTGLGLLFVACAPPATPDADDAGDDGESVGWVLAAADALQRELRAARALIFEEDPPVRPGGPREGVATAAPEQPATAARRAAPDRQVPATAARRAAAVLVVREHAAALRDMAARRRTPIFRFLEPSARHAMRAALDEVTVGAVTKLHGVFKSKLRGQPIRWLIPAQAAICAGVAHRMRQTPSPGDEGDALLRLCLRHEARAEVAPRPVARPSPRRASAAASPRGEPSRSEDDDGIEAASRLAELGWLKNAWLDNVADDALVVAARHVEKRAARTARRGLRAVAADGSEQHADAAAATAAAAKARVAAARRSADARRDADAFATMCDSLAADRAWRRLQASVHVAGWSPLAESSPPVVPQPPPTVPQPTPIQY